MVRDRRQIGTETLIFSDGTELEVKIHSVPNYYMLKHRRQYRKTKLDKSGNLDNVEFEDENYILEILKLSMGSQVTKEDLMDCENNLKEILDKYFGKLDKSKKLKSTDMLEPNQDKKSEA